MKNKLISNVCGGLGNQFFMYAAAYTVAKNNSYDLLIDKSFYASDILYKTCGYDLDKIVPNLKEIKLPFYCDFLSLASPKYIQYIGRVIKGVHFKFQKKYIEKKHFCYDSSINNVAPNTRLCGCYQSYKYFTSYSNEIIAMFSKLPLSSPRLQVAAKITNPNITSVSIHYRDYTDLKASMKNFANYIGMLKKDYYKQAIEIINKKYKNAKFYVFSNKISTARKVLQKIDNLEFIEYTYDNTWEDMKLMSLCDHNIIANSSYSWWAAYLNTNNNKTIIAPKSWGNLLKGRENTNDLLPIDWIKI